MVCISSTFLKQTIRDELIEGEYDDDNIYMIDGAVSLKRGNDRHWSLIREIMQYTAVKVIEHPDLFVQKGEYSITRFRIILLN